ncbi:peptidase inhibitor 16 [Mytilus galloprovincialis]|uniref:Peptidase inhibitor 16 n=1 Tax=Mytilus galloprovincialis TaxID=29158 RepID=A0A8B6ESJ4_MYTGA|nr:peptidase inhibitor 16 [Mytilus galloprovincialis]
MTTAEELSQEQKDKIVSMHNKIRYDVKDGDLLELKWDDELASKASGWAQNCQWPHNPDRQSTLGTVGENIAVTKGGIVEGINYLASEKKQWNYETECEVKDGCGHYTQLIWENTEKVGCGLQKCDSISGLDSDFNGYEYLVCNY